MMKRSPEPEGPPKQRNGARFFEVHKNGKNVYPHKTFATLWHARLDLDETAVGAEIVEIDAFDRVIRRYALQDDSQSAVGVTSRGAYTSINSTRES